MHLKLGFKMAAVYSVAFCSANVVLGVPGVAAFERQSGQDGSRATPIHIPQQNIPQQFVPQSTVRNYVPLQDRV